MHERKIFYVGFHTNAISNEKLLNLILERLDGRGERAAVGVRSDGHTDNRARNSTGSAERMLAFHKYVRNILVLKKNGEAREQVKAEHGLTSQRRGR